MPQHAIDYMKYPDNDGELFKISLEDELDLHHFHPRDAKDVLREFIEIAAAKDKKLIRIVHGKGKSHIKSIVIKELEHNSRILSYRDDGSNWGATIAVIRQK